MAKRILREKQSKKESNPGLFVYAGEVEQSDFDNLPFRDKIKDYIAMLDSDGIINTSINALFLPIIESGFKIYPGRDTLKAVEAANYIQWVWDNQKQGFNYFLEHCLYSIPMGLALFEKVTNRGMTYFNGEKNKITNIYNFFSPIQLDTIRRFNYDDDIVFAGIEHELRRPDQGATLIDIDSDKLFALSYKMKFGNIEGNSILRPIREVWNYKKKIVNAMTRGIVRGAGVPVATVTGNIDDTTKASIQKIMRTIGNSENAYAIEQNEKFTIRFLQLQNQENSMPLLEMFNREIFFNSSTQFMTSGVANVGAQASTVEHKQTYILAANSILKWLETDCFQPLSNELIDIGYLAGIDAEDYPQFTFNEIKETDTLKLSQSISNLFLSGVVAKREGDEDYIREMFGFPVVDKKDAIVKQEQNNEDSASELREGEDAKEQLNKKCNHDIRLSNEYKLGLDIFELESAEEGFIKSQEKTESVVDEMIDKILMDVYLQVKNDQYKDLNIKYGQELTNKLTAVYETNYERGQRDVSKELKKLSSSLKLALDPVGKKKVRNGIARAIKRFFSSIKTAVEAKLEIMSAVQIEKAGGMRNVILAFGDKFKTDRRSLITATESGYGNGRGDLMDDFKNDIDKWIYIAILDKALCDACAPTDGLIVDEEDIANLGLAFGQPVNSNCFGQDKCRCQLVPFELKK